MGIDGPEAANQRAGWLERYLAVPVLIAALAAVPAVLLAQWGEGWPAQIGSVVNWLSGIVLWGEWILLIVLADNKRAWLSDHKWSAVAAVATIPAVLLLLGPLQVLRLIPVIAALPLTRLTRIFEAGTVIRRRMGLRGSRRTAVVAAAAAATIFAAAVILLDPASDTRILVDRVMRQWETWRLMVTGVLIAGVTGALVLYYRSRSD